MSKTTYTFHKISNLFELRSTTCDHKIVIEPGASKYPWMEALEPGRIVNISESGRWNSSISYHNEYGGGLQNTGKTTKVITPINVTLTKLDDLDIDNSLFDPLPTNTIFDQFCSTEGGFLPGTNVMFAAGPGLGKTTIGCELLSKLHDAGKKVIFISAEMNQIDMSRYLKRFPHWGQIPMLFLADYSDNSAKQVIEQVLAEGYDMVFTDSFSEVCDTVKEDSNLSRGAVEKWFLTLMNSHNTGNNKLKKYTTFLTILQVGKSGVFSGSNKLKHMSSAMIHLEWDGSENNGKRYMYFSKNRVGQVGKKLYYSLDGGVKFDSKRFTRDIQNDETLAAERTQLAGESNSFDALFGFNKLSADEYKTEDALDEKVAS
jgi:predicted ATP-dependent serine protease